MTGPNARPTGTTTAPGSTPRVPAGRSATARPIRRSSAQAPRTGAAPTACRVATLAAAPRFATVGQAEAAGYVADPHNPLIAYKRYRADIPGLDEPCPDTTGYVPPVRP